MQITGMLYGSRLLNYIGYPTSEVLGPLAGKAEGVIFESAIPADSDIREVLL